MRFTNVDKGILSEYARSTSLALEAAMSMIAEMSADYEAQKDYIVEKNKTICKLEETVKVEREQAQKEIAGLRRRIDEMTKAFREETDNLAGIIKGKESRLEELSARLDKAEKASSAESITLTMMTGEKFRFDSVESQKKWPTPPASEPAPQWATNLLCTQRTEIESLRKQVEHATGDIILWRDTSHAYKERLRTILNLASGSITMNDQPKPRVGTLVNERPINACAEIPLDAGIPVDGRHVWDGDK